MEKKVEPLEKENAFFRDRLAKYENPRNSPNSSMPSSRDENLPKKHQSLRTPLDKKPGGQKGRKGNTLGFTAFLDLVIELQPDYCNNCGSSLQNRPPIKGKSSPKIDIPPIKAIYTEYQSFGKVCNWGYLTTVDFPQGVYTPESYEENIKALVAYFHTRQFLPLPG